MLDSLKQTGKNISRELTRAWESLSEGWRELLSGSSNALTHFSGHNDTVTTENNALSTFPRWSLLAGEVEETDKDIMVRVELPGIDKKDCRITIEGNVLYVSGEKHYERESGDSTYHVMERAYGAFQRSIPLPRNIDASKAEAKYKNGVLHIRLPKADEEKSRKVTLS